MLYGGDKHHPWFANHEFHRIIDEYAIRELRILMEKLKQPALKPQDLLVVLKLAVSKGEFRGFATLAGELSMSASEIHAGVRRARVSRLIEREGGTPVVNRSALHEFLLYGVKYAFPAVEGPVLRGLPTSVSAPPFRQSFEQATSLPLVWPDAKGEVRGIALCPLYPSVPAACKQDAKLYHALAALDAIRGGAARERQIAEQVLFDAMT